MARLKRKPDYDGKRTMEELMAAVCEYYGTAVDDRKEILDHVSLREVSEYFDITIMKARKILITAGLYSTETSRNVQRLVQQGNSLSTIIEKTGLKKSSINSYLPYTNIVYKLPDISIKAERQKQYRVRNRNRRRSSEEQERELWAEIEYLQGCLFTTYSGLNYTYRIKIEEMIIDCENERLSKSLVMRAYKLFMKQTISGSGGNHGEDNLLEGRYLFPLFNKMGLANKSLIL